MHGKNEVRPMSGDNLLQVHKIFYTIQGEGPFAGMTAVFIRLSGCNLRCHFCDTAWDDVKDPHMFLEDILADVEHVAGVNCNLVVLTGGEPARQNCHDLVMNLNARGYIIQMETAGTYWQDWMSLTTIVCSPKTKHINDKVTEFCNNWKYVVRAGATDDEGLPNETTQVEDPALAPFRIQQTLTFKYGNPAPPPDRVGVTTWISPCDEGDPVKNLANVQWVAKVCLHHGYRASLQIHKYMQLP